MKEGREGRERARNRLGLCLISSAFLPLTDSLFPANIHHRTKKILSAPPSPSLQPPQPPLTVSNQPQNDLRSHRDRLNQGLERGSSRCYCCWRNRRSRLSRKLVPTLPGVSCLYPYVCKSFCRAKELTQSSLDFIDLIRIAPKYTSLAASFPQAKFLRVDVDAQKAIAAKYKVSAMPTFLAIKAGQVVQTVRPPSSVPPLLTFLGS